MKLDPTLKADWMQEEGGWWCSSNPMLAAIKEDDGKWYSYLGGEIAKTTPSFRTMREAMINAEKRYAASGEKGTP